MSLLDQEMLIRNDGRVRLRVNREIGQGIFYMPSLRVVAIFLFATNLSK